MTRREGPPRLARALLELLAPTRTGREASADLDEEYARYVRPERGQAAADFWYWRQAMLSVPRLLSRRLAGVGRGLAGLASELRLAGRFLRRRPAFTAAAVSTLALGIGVNTTVFGVAHAVVLRPLPYGDADRLVRPVPDQLFFLDSSQAELFTEAMTTFDAFAAWGRSLFLFSGGAGAEEVRGARVSWNHFDVLRVDPLLGRTFVHADAASGDALVLSHGLWTRRFGADPSIVGSRVDVSGGLRTVVGVLRPEHVPLEFDWEAWWPLPLDLAEASGSALAGTGRLRDGATLEQARAELRRVLPQVWSADGSDPIAPEAAAQLRLGGLREWLLGDAGVAIWALTSAVLLVLLLACVNVGALALAQGRARRREFALRLALGGGATRLTRQIFVELLVVSGLGAVGGLAASVAAFSWLRAHIPAEVPRSADVALTPSVWIFAIVAGVAVATVAAIVPARRARADGAAVARSGGTATGTREAERARATLVAIEVALAVVLVIGAGLMIRTFSALRSVDPGFDQSGVVTLRPAPPSDRYPGGPELEAYYAAVMQSVSALPGVTSVGAIQFLPMTPGGWWSGYRPLLGTGAVGEEHSTAVRVVHGDYFGTMRVPVLAGRVLEAADAEIDGPVRVVVNESFAREAFGSEPAVGRTVGIFDGEAEVVGVVADVRQTGVREESHAELYLAYGSNPWRRLHLVARVAGDERSTLAAVGSAVRRVDAEVALLGPRPLAEVVAATWADARLVTALLTLFGVVGLGLGAVGVYGVAAQSALERRREIGIRLTLGASGGRVTRRALLGGLTPVLIGLVAGLVGASFAVRLLGGLLYGVPDTDPATWIAAPAVLALVATVSLWVPAHVASRIDPVRTLRED